MHYEIASQSEAVSRQVRTVVSTTLAFRTQLVRRSFLDRAVVVESIAARLTIYLVALLCTNLALSGCGTASEHAGKSFEIASVVTSVGGTPRAAVKTYTIVILNHLARPVYLNWIEVPSSKTSRARV
jgi:hypothetical protein